MKALEHIVQKVTQQRKKSHHILTTQHALTKQLKTTNKKICLCDFCFLAYVGRPQYQI